MDALLALEGLSSIAIDDLVQEVPTTAAPDIWTLGARAVEGFFMGLQIAHWIWG